MKFYCFCSAFLLVLIQLSLHSSSEAYTIDPCGSLKCPETEISCLLLIPETRSYECKCKKSCKSPSLIRSPFVRLVSSKTTKNPKSMRQINDSVTPAAKQYGSNNNNMVVTVAPGGPSCYPSACMNGGTCYSTPYPTTTTTRAYTTAPICSCQPSFTGSRCELYTPAPTQAPSDAGWNNLCRVYNDRNLNICQNGGQCIFISDGKVACICPSTYTGQFCEQPVYIQCTGAYAAQCHRDYGTCGVDGSCRCISGYTGPKCDQKNQNYNPATNPPYVPATNPPSPYNPATYPPSPYNPATYPPYNPATNPPSSYNPYNPATNPPSSYNPYNPVTNPPYNPVTNPPYNPVTYPPYNPATNPPYNQYPVVTAPSFYPLTSQQPSGGCPFGYCMNGGTCVQLGGNVYVSSSFICICGPCYTGNRCEQYLPNGGGVTPPVTTIPGQTTTTTSAVTSTYQPHCNYTISLLNDGAYSARYIVEYYIDGVKQQNIISNTLAFIGQYTAVTIPYYATNVSVTLQNLGFQWNDIAKDSNLNTLNYCAKCYKTWNTVTDPKWDHLAC